MALADETIKNKWLSHGVTTYFFICLKPLLCNLRLHHFEGDYLLGF